jgi:glutamyl-Q tRNA(Asp) synthetase
MPHYITLPTDIGILEPGNVITRFAPSPNGYLHMGHAYSAICAHDFARANSGIFQLRIEDIDGMRSRSEHRQAIVSDMSWLGLSWDGDVIYQSLREPAYRAALERLKAMDLVYRCDCTRGDIAAAIRNKPVPHGPDGPVYPGTCRHKSLGQDTEVSWRLDMKSAIAAVAGEALLWHDLAEGEQIADPSLFGDVVLWRKDAMASYHLAATTDDASDGVTHVVRGKDLFAYTAVHIVLQKLLGLLQPVYWHHGLLSSDNTEKLAKSRSSEPLRALRERGDDGATLADDIRRGNLPLGISLLGD